MSQTAQELKQLYELEKQISEAKQSLHAYMALPENANLSFVEFAKKIAKKDINLVNMLTCPIGVTYFSKFLESERNLENLLCYGEVNAIIDFVKQLCIQGEEDVQLRQAVHKKLTKLMNRYLVVDSPQEVNLPASSKNTIVQTFTSAITLLEAVHSENCLIAVNNALELLKDELVTNMADPFSRYTKSDLFLELGAAFFSKKVDILAQREKILSSSKNSSSSSEDALNLMIRGNWDQNIAARHPASVIEDLLEQIFTTLTLLPGSAWDSSSLSPDYSLLQSNAICGWMKFKEFSSELSAIDISLLYTNEQKLAFFINLYNTMMLHAALEYQGVPSCPINWLQFSRKIKYNVGGLFFSLDQISHGILRSNQKHYLFGKRFNSSEKMKISLIPSHVPSTIAFSLINMQEYSPRVKVYKSQTVLEQVDASFVEYFKQYTKLNEKDDSIQVPSLVKEYAHEFLGRANNKNDLIPFLRCSSSELMEIVQNASKVNYYSSNNEHSSYYNSVLPLSVIETIQSTILLEKKNNPHRVGNSSKKQVNNSFCAAAPRKIQSGKQKVKNFLHKASKFAKKFFNVRAQ